MYWLLERLSIVYKIAWTSESLIVNCSWRVSLYHELVCISFAFCDTLISLIVFFYQVLKEKVNLSWPKNAGGYLKIHGFKI